VLTHSLRGWQNFIYCAIFTISSSIRFYGLGLMACANSESLLKLQITSTFGRTPWAGISPKQGLYLVLHVTRQHTERINIHALSGIGTQYPRTKAHALCSAAIVIGFSTSSCIYSYCYDELFIFVETPIIETQSLYRPKRSSHYRIRLATNSFVFYHYRFLASVKNSFRSLETLYYAANSPIEFSPCIILLYFVRKYNLSFRLIRVERY
jgi:hypothetical protein